MIISRSPLRISLGGGGTDLPSFYKKKNGFVISASINKYIYLSVNNNLTNEIFIRYSKNEKVKKLSLLKHDLFRESLKYFKISNGIEITSLADIQSGTGLGSSGAFTVGLVNAISRLKHHKLSKSQIASIACYIEMNILKRGGGKQDQYASSIGGVTYQSYLKNGNVRISRPIISNDKLRELSKNLLLFYTGKTRNASKILNAQNTSNKNNNVYKNLIETKKIGYSVKKILDDGDFKSYGEILNMHWQLKRKRVDKMSNRKIDQLYDLGINNGAVGGKLVGAGSGGFFLFYARDKKKLRKAMIKNNIPELEFEFEFEGTSILNA